MNAAFIVILACALSGCAHWKAKDEEKGAFASSSPESPSDKWLRLSDSKEIDQRAAYYEDRGLTPKEARAAAEIEYYKSGK